MPLEPPLASEMPANSTPISVKISLEAIGVATFVSSVADSETPENADTQKEEANPPKTHYPLSFWLCFASLCGAGLISGLDSTVLSTSLPTIIHDLNGGSNYIWAVNVYFLTW